MDGAAAASPAMCNPRVTGVLINRTYAAGAPEDTGTPQICGNQGRSHSRSRHSGHAFSDYRRRGHQDHDLTTKSVLRRRGAIPWGARARITTTLQTRGIQGGQTDSKASGGTSPGWTRGGRRVRQGARPVTGAPTRRPAPRRAPRCGTARAPLRSGRWGRARRR